MAAPIRSRLTLALVGVLGLSVLVALLTRTLGLDFGVPDLWHPDEQRLIYNPGKSFAIGEGLRLPWWPYPPLMAELVGTVLWLFPFDPPTLRAIAVGRGISAGLGVVGVSCTAMAGWTLTQRAAPSLTAALLVALSPIAVQLGHYATPDGAALGCVGLTLWACASLLRTQGTPWAYLAAGVATGLAAAFKYNAAMVAVLVVGCMLVRGARIQDQDQDQGRAALAREFGWLLLAGLAAIAVFGSSLIPVWDEVGDLGRGLDKEWAHYRKGHVGFSTEHPGADVLATLAGSGLGLPALLGMGALVLLRDAERSMAAVICLFTAAYMALLWPQRVFFDRVVFVLIPPLALLASLSIEALATRVLQRAARSRQQALVWVLSVGLLAVPAYGCTQFLIALRTPDTRAQARDYLLEVSTKEDKILHVPRDVYLAPTISGRENLRPDTRRRPGIGLRRRPRYVVMVEGYWQRFENNPIDSRVLLEARDRWERALSRSYRVSRSFEGPPLPCSTCPGTTLGAYHHPRVTIYERRVP